MGHDGENVSLEDVDALGDGLSRLWTFRNTAERPISQDICGVSYQTTYTRVLRLNRHRRSLLCD